MGTKEACLDILVKLGLQNWKLGKTKVFLKYYHAEKLSKMYDDLMRKIVVVQSAIRRWLARKTFAHRKALVNKSATIIQRCKYIAEDKLNHLFLTLEYSYRVQATLGQEES